MPSTLKEKVKAAAKDLDEQVPGWDEKVAAEELNINSFQDCILGQIYGHYNDAPPRLRLNNCFAFSDPDAQPVWVELLDKRVKKAKKKAKKEASNEAALRGS